MASAGSHRDPGMGREKTPGQEGRSLLCYLVWEQRGSVVPLKAGIAWGSSWRP